MKRNFTIFIAGLASLSMLVGCNLNPVALLNGNDSAKQTPAVEEDSNEELKAQIAELQSKVDQYEAEKEEAEKQAEAEANPVLGEDFPNDMKHIIFNGEKITFGKTKSSEFDDSYLGYVKEDGRKTVKVAPNYYESLEAHPLNDTGRPRSSDEEVTFGFCNLGSSNELMNDCVLYSIRWVCNGVFNGNSAKDSGLTFDLGSGLTECATYDDFVNVLGEPVDEYSFSSYKTYTWGEYTQDNYELVIYFVKKTDEVCGIEMRGKIKGSNADM